MLITYFSKRRCISSILSFVKALIYMSSSIIKGGIESVTNPRVVLVIHNNIYVIELMSIQDENFRMFNDWYGKD